MALRAPNSDIGALMAAANAEVSRDNPDMLFVTAFAAILDLDTETTVDPSRFHSRSRNTPFGGWQLHGGPWMTIVGGELVRAVGR